MAKNARGKPIRTPIGTLSFPNLVNPRSFEGGPAKYGATLIFDEGTDLKALRKAVEAVALEQWKGKAKKLRSPFRDGEEKDHLDGYGPGKVFISASSSRRPGVVGPRRDPETGEFPVIDQEEELYPGLRVRATIVPFAYDVKGNRGVAFGLNSLQVCGEGEPLGSFSRAQDDYDEVEGIDDEPDEDAAPGDSAGMFE